MYNAVLNSPIGKIGIKLSNNHLTHIDFVPAQTNLITPAEPAAINIVSQLQNYFKNPCYKFELKLALQGTSFQQNVWNSLLNIPLGKAWSYGELAKQLKTSPRAIGNACRRNPIPVVIPCHRIVAQQHLGGYAGDTDGNNIKIKTWLLQHEGFL